MNRRSFGLAALGALFIGTLAGGTTRLPSAYAGPPATQQDSAVAQEPVARKKPPTPCKTTKECPQDHVCTKVSDHKECTPTLIRPPVAPVVT